MSNKLDIRLKPDHVGGGFEWEREPHCSCGMLKQAVDENKFIFVNNIGDGGSNLFYMMPVSADGTLAKSDGVAKLIRFRINFLFVDHQTRCHIALFR